MKTISVTSGKGGVGKTVVTVNLGIALAETGQRVLLVDGDLGLANIDIISGISCQHTLLDVIEGRKSIDQVLIEAFPGVTVLPASSGILKMERLSHEERLRLAGQLQSLSEKFDLLLFDTGAGISENVIFFNTLADDVLLVTTPDPAAVTDSYALTKILASNYAIDHVVLVINQVESIIQGALVYERINSVCQNFLSINLRYGGCLLKDAALEKAVVERKPVWLARPEAPVNTGFRALAARFSELFDSAPRDRAEGFWKAWLSQWPHPPQPRR